MRARRVVLPGWVRRIDRRAAAWRNRRWAPHPIDRLLRWLSHRANRGVLWIALAGVIALLGGRAGRRAAVRGLASLGTASILANLVGKTLLGGERPLLDEVPFRRPLSRPPTSPSFPSGHAASAAAFVTGVALESPPAGAALAPVALGVAYSRGLPGGVPGRARGGAHSHDHGEGPPPGGPLQRCAGARGIGR